MKLSNKPLLTRGEIAARVGELAREIRDAYGGEEIVLLAVLAGAVHFASDLMRALGPPAALDFVRAKRYEGMNVRDGVQFLVHPKMALQGRHVLVVEDILDTGVTARAILDYLGGMDTASLRCSALLDKPTRRQVPIEADFTGFTIPDAFVVGYGLDLDERYRELPDIHIMETSDGAGGFSS